MWEADGDPTYDPDTDFTLAMFETTVWIPANASSAAYVAWWGAHTATVPLHIPMRRWVSDVHGPALSSVASDQYSSAGC